jgi:hypothetical protein
MIHCLPQLLLLQVHLLSITWKKLLIIPSMERIANKDYEVRVSIEYYHVTETEKTTTMSICLCLYASIEYYYVTETDKTTTMPKSTKIVKSTISIPKVKNSKVTRSIRDIVRSFWAPVTTRRPWVSRYTIRSTRYDTTTSIVSTRTPFPIYYFLTWSTNVPKLSTSWVW